MDKEYRTKERKASTSRENSGPAVYDGLRSIACSMDVCVCCRGISDLRTQQEKKAGTKIARGAKYFSLLQASRPALVHARPLIKWVSVLFPGAKALWV